MRIFSNISSKNYARTQRVSSKIGTTENLGDFLQDWFTGGTGGPVDVIGSSFGVLENAEQGVVQVYDEFDIEPPVYDSNPVFIPVQSFVHGDDENEIYWFHPDHLGSTSYITNLLGEVSQHMEYFAFGETFVEEHRSSNNSSYKFNGKELDEETGWYYYGARYYDPRISVWLSVDPLANVDYIMNNEAYINGEHNGGVFNSFNHNSYGYCYQNPLVYVDPNGKQSVSEILGGLKKIFNSIWSTHDFSGDKPRERTNFERQQEFVSGTVQVYNNIATKETGHFLLDVGGLIPVFGEPLDAANSIWYAFEGDYLNAGLSAAAMIPIAGSGFTGGKLIIKSLVKSDSKILKLAKQSFEGNNLLSKEANSLIKQVMEGNFKSGRGTKDIGDGIFELRGHTQGARVYYRMNNDVMEILGYSNKNNQQKVIDAIKKQYGK